ncbi:MAG TPA: porin [Casimicrobiaceae bacterium]
MNKKLVALAVAGAFALPLAAQAQTANVTLYGRINIDTEVIINAKQDTSTPANQVKGNFYRVASNSSRLGVRGTESLGGGTNAIFQIEERFDASSQSTVTNGGDSFVGLQGGWGTMKIGYFLTPYDDIAPIFGSVPTLITGILGSSAVWSNTGWIGNSQAAGAFDDRAGNSLRYDTPNISGFTASFQIAGRDASGNDEGGDLTQQRRHAVIYGVNGLYTNGPFQAGIAYESHNKTRAGTLQNAAHDQAWTIAAAYTFGPVKLSGVFEQVKYDSPLLGATPVNGDLKRNMWGVSMIGNFGPGQMYAGWFRGNDGKGSAACVTVAGVTTCPRVGAVTQGDQTGVNMYEVSYTYPLSKRTLMYAGYVMIDNDKNAAYNFHVNQITGVCTGNGAVCGDSARPQGLALGIVHFW